MINKCRSLNIILTICNLTNSRCPYMADPQSCPSYGEEFESRYQSHPDWVDHLRGELDGLGIKTEIIEEEEKAPDWF